MATIKKQTATHKTNIKKIATPAIMWTLFDAYRKQTKAKPTLKHDFVGGQGRSVKRKLERPLTFEGFKNYCADKGILQDPKDYFSNKEDRYIDFVSVCSRIKDVIRQDQIEGGMCGIYNPSITQRLNNLVEKTEQVTIEQPLFPDVR